MIVLSHPSHKNRALDGSRKIMRSSGMKNLTEPPATLQPNSTAPIPASTAATYDADNHVLTAGSDFPPSYDAAGDVMCDSLNTNTTPSQCVKGNQYFYDAEGRICEEYTVMGGTMTGYLYDAEGNRVAKGTVQHWGSCDPAVNGFAMSTEKDDVRGQGGEQMSELSMDANGNMAWQHTNVWAAGTLIGTYDNNGLHFYLNDWLGTRRVQTDYEGVIEQTCSSLPYGNAETCTPFPTENLFTGKERDTESGNDYFGARYYASTMGRFLSPDWDSSPVAIPYADRTNPQSFNLYSYAGNNPLSRTDPDGHCTNGGQQKGFWWCLFNDSDQDADRARQQLAQYKNISINGKTPADAAKGLSNSQTVQLERSVFNYISSQAMSTPGMMIALAIVPGAAEDLVPAEAAAAESGSLANLNKSLASQEQMGQLAAGQGAPIAGAGTSTVLRDADRLAAQYGGSPADWQKVSSAHYTPAGSEGTTAGFETHAYQNVKTGQVVEMKTKINPN
jgi:RHS repeat-associated protein